MRTTADSKKEKKYLTDIVLDTKMSYVICEEQFGKASNE